MFRNAAAKAYKAPAVRHMQKRFAGGSGKLKDETDQALCAFGAAAGLSGAAAVVLNMTFSSEPEGHHH